MRLGRIVPAFTRVFRHAGIDITIKMGRIYVIRLNLILLALPISGSLGLVRGPLFIVQSHPALTNDLADLTKHNARILVSDILALLVGKEHVGGQTAPRGIGV